LTDLNVQAHIFHTYNLRSIIFAVIKRRLIQYWVECMQFFLRIIIILSQYFYYDNRIISVYLASNAVASGVR